MKKILLVCSAGMSTNLLVLKMQEAAKKAGEEVEIIAIPSSSCKEVINDVDVVLLSPQVRFQKSTIEEMIAQRPNGIIPLDIINMQEYSIMNGKAVFEKAMNLLK